VTRQTCWRSPNFDFCSREDAPDADFAQAAGGKRPLRKPS
jgi:hypothetical protein